MTQKKFDVEESFIRTIIGWKFAWMNQTQNNQQDYENYHRRAFGIDANMVHSLAKRLSENVEVISHHQEVVFERILNLIDCSDWADTNIQHWLESKRDLIIGKKEE